MVRGRVYREDMDDTFIGVGRIDHFVQNMRQLTLIVDTTWWTIDNVYDLTIQGSTIRFSGRVANTSQANAEYCKGINVEYRLEMV